MNLYNTIQCDYIILKLLKTVPQLMVMLCQLPPYEEALDSACARLGTQPKQKLLSPRVDSGGRGFPSIPLIQPYQFGQPPHKIIQSLEPGLGPLHLGEGGKPWQ